jgi:hypothetical protein
VNRRIQTRWDETVQPPVIDPGGITRTASSRRGLLIRDLGGRARELTIYRCGLHDAAEALPVVATLYTTETGIHIEARRGINHNSVLGTVVSAPSSVWFRWALLEVDESFVGCCIDDDGGTHAVFTLPRSRLLRDAARGAPSKRKSITLSSSDLR